MAIQRMNKGVPDWHLIFNALADALEDGTALPDSVVKLLEGAATVPALNIQGGDIFNNSIFFGNPTGATVSEKAQKVPAIFAKPETGHMYARATDPDGKFNQVTMNTASEGSISVSTNVSGTVAARPIWNGFNLPVETGTWTPVFYGTATAGSHTYMIRTATYYRVGKMVLASFYIQVTKDASVAGAPRIGGLPFTNDSIRAGGAIFNHITGISGQSGRTIIAGMGAAENTFLIQALNGGDVVALDTQASFGTVFMLQGTITYYTND